MKRYWLLSCAALLAAVVLLGFSEEPAAPFQQSRQLIAVRKAGHELLLSGGDRHTLVPVLQEGAGGYRLSLPEGWTLPTDSVVAITDRVFRASAPGSEYVVELVDRVGGEVFFGYAMLRDSGKTLVPCLGREMPRRGYDLRIQFQEPQAGSWRRAGAAALGAIALGIFVAGVRTMRRKKAAGIHQRDEDIGPSRAGVIALGHYRFVAGEQCLYFQDARIALTTKEAQLLQVFAARPNELIDRKDLQRIWEDEGVIVGRSLDVFVSRLRKKLEGDPQLAIVSVTGKGYRLDCHTQLL